MTTLTYETFTRSTILPLVDGDEDRPVVRPEERRRFEPIGELGVGGIGEVLAARDLDIGRRVAIKRLRKDRISNHAVYRFVQEVRTVGALDHPNIVPIYDVGQEPDGTFYFVMKYVDGETLESLVQRLRARDRAAHAEWTIERRISLFVQVLHAIEFAHAQGILHRDLKPANVMIGRHGEVWLLDWGIAKRVLSGESRPDASTLVGTESAAELVGAAAASLGSTDTRVGALIGTPQYMAPEQARGEPATVRSETYSAALVLYELLTLWNPREGAPDLATVVALAQRPVPLTRLAPRQPAHALQEHVPAEVMWFLHDALQVAPAKRFGSTAEMLSWFEARAEGHYAIRCPTTFKKQMLLRAARGVERWPVVSTALLRGWLALLAGGAMVTGGAVVAALSSAAALVFWR